MCNVLVSFNGVLGAMLERKIDDGEVHRYPSVAAIPPDVMDSADAVFYDESTVSFAALADSPDLGDRLVILTEKRPELISCVPGARVFTFPLDLDDVCQHLEKICA